jgi:hypothetical protein
MTQNHPHRRHTESYISLSLSLVFILLLLILSCTKPAAPDYIVSTLNISPQENLPGIETMATVTITNRGDAPGPYTVSLLVDNSEFAKKEVNIAPHSSENITFKIVKESAGTYKLSCGGQNAALVIKENPIYADTRNLMIDGENDFFDGQGNKATGESYLDIREGTVTKTGNFWVYTWTMSGPLPTSMPDPTVVLRWDCYVDMDCNSGTGLNDSLLCNDIGADAICRLEFSDGKYKTSVFNATTNASYGNFDFMMNGNGFEGRVQSSSGMRKFNFVCVARKFQKNEGKLALIAIDKAPNAGHYHFDLDQVMGVDANVASGLPTETLESANATIFYNKGADNSAKWYREGFEYAYLEIGKKYGLYAKQKFKLYVYNSQADLVQGLQKISGWSSGDAQYYDSPGAAPRPLNYVMHIPPSMAWQTVAHEYTHTLLEELSGTTYQSIKWLDEGLADYVSYSIMLNPKYNDSADSFAKLAVSNVKSAAKNGELRNIQLISTAQQWHASNYGTSARDLQYSESFVITSYMAEKYRIEKCFGILKSMYKGESQTSAIYTNLGITQADLYANFLSYVNE